MSPPGPDAGTATARVAVVGSMNMDFINLIDSHPRIGSHVVTTKSLRFPGGHGVNQAVACARLSGVPRAFLLQADYRPDSAVAVPSGVEVFMFGIVGGDRYGKDIKAELKQNEVNIDGVRTIEEDDTGYAHISVNLAGDPTVIFTPGAYSNFVPGPLFDPKITPNVVVVSLEIPMEMVVHALAWAKEHKAMTICNAAPATPSVPDEIFQVDHFIVNEQQADILNGIEGVLFDDRFVQQKDIRQHYQELCEKFHGYGAASVVITMAELGVVGSDKDPVSGIRQQYCFAAEQGKGLPVVDTTGASDAFIGGYTVELVHQKQAGLRQDIASAMKLGIKAGGLTVSKVGSMPAIPFPKDIMKTTFCAAPAPNARG